MYTRFISVPQYASPTLCGVTVADDAIYYQCINYEDLMLLAVSCVVAVGIVETARKAFNICFWR